MAFVLASLTFAAMLVWTPLVYIMGNYLPQYFIPGAGGAAVTGMYIHDLVGLSVTPERDGHGAMTRKIA